MIEHWPAPAWARDAVFYQIFPERFFNGDPANDPPGTAPWDSPPTRENFLGGDLAGIRARLDYLQWLGVGALYLTPFFRARTNHRYDTSDYLEVDPAAGTLDEFRGLAADAHQRGVLVVAPVQRDRQFVEHLVERHPVAIALGVGQNAIAVEDDQFRLGHRKPGTN